MYHFLILLLCLYTATSFTFDSTPQYYVPTTTTDDWQLCYAFAASENSPTFTDIRGLCGDGPLAFGQTSAVNPYNYAVVYRAFRNSTIDLTVNTTGTVANYTSFSTPTSFGIGAAAITNCSAADSNTVLCWTVNSTGSDYYFAPGGYTNWDGDGYQLQTNIIRVIYSAPCFFKTVGQSCTVPGAGLCNPGTCLGNVTCDNATIPTPPFVDNNTCSQVGTCDPYTGNYSIVPKPVASQCFGGDYCITTWACNNISQCVPNNATAPCPVTPNSCQVNPTCISGVSGYTCLYQNNDNAICQFDDDYLCRTNDVCVAQNCTAGTPKVNLYNTTDCILGFTCNNVTGVVSRIYAPSGTTCQPTNQCLQPGQCDGAGFCNSTQALPIPGATFCNPGRCNPTNGQFTLDTSTIANTGLPCTPPGPPQLCKAYNCMVGNCTFSSNVTCAQQTCYDSSCTDDSIGCEYVPQNGTTCVVGSFCEGVGLCLKDLIFGNTSQCVMSGPTNCSAFVPPFYDSACGFYYCDLVLNTCAANTTGVLGNPCSSNPCVPLSASKCNALAQCSGPTIYPNNPACRQQVSLGWRRRVFWEEWVV